MKRILIFFCFLAVLAGCKRPLDPIGPEYAAAGADFKILGDFNASIPTVNFRARTNNTVKYSTLFSQKVSWKLTLTGLSSGAIKTFSGLTDRLDSTNTFWDGRHSDLYFFRAERVAAELSFLGSSLVYKDTVRITQPRIWNVPNKVVTVLDFEATATDVAYTFFDGPFQNFPTYRSTFAEKGGVLSDMSELKNNKKDTVLRNYSGAIISTEKTGSLQGWYSHRMAGKDGIYTQPGSSQYFIGGTGFGRLVPGLDANPNNVYFNIYVYGFGDGSKLGINFNEDDNNSKVYNEGGQVDNYIIQEDEFATEINIDWVGWRMVSIKYSDLRLSAAGQSTKFGNGILEPNKLAKMGFVLLSPGPGKEAIAIFDFAVFTMGKPFDPKVD